MDEVTARLLDSFREEDAAACRTHSNSRPPAPDGGVYVLGTGENVGGHKMERAPKTAETKLYDADLFCTVYKSAPDVDENAYGKQRRSRRAKKFVIMRRSISDK